MRQLRCRSGRRSLVQREQTQHTGSDAARRRDSTEAFSSSTFARSRATCRINGTTSRRCPLSLRYSAARHRPPRFFCFFSFSRTRFAFSGATWGARAAQTFFPQHKRTGARAASHTRSEHLSRSRAVLRESDRDAVQVRGCGATTVRDDPGDEKRPTMFWEIAFKMKRGFSSALLVYSLWVFFSLL